MTRTMLSQPVSTTSYRNHLFRTVSNTTNALPAYRNNSMMDKLVEQELVDHILWEENSLPQDVKSILDTFVLNTNFILESISKIHYSLSDGPREKIKGGPVFRPASRSAGGVWQLNEKNVQPTLLVNSRPSRKKKAQKWQKAQKTQPRALMSTVAAWNDGEVGSDFLFTTSKIDKIFGANGCDNKNLNKEWLLTSETSEGKLPLLFNTIRAAMHMMYAKSFPIPSPAFPFNSMDVVGGPPKRIWFSSFFQTPIPDNTTAQKQDIILVDGNLRGISLRWCNIMTWVEHTESELTTRTPLYWDSATKGYILMRGQPWRRFVLIFSIACNKLRLHYFDRSGLIISRPVSVVAHPVRLLEVLNTLTLAHTNTLGYDPTMHICDPTCRGTHLDLRDNAIGWVEGSDKAHLSIMSVLWQSQGLFSRGTICYRVQNSHGVGYALKDCWVAEDEKNHKVTVLRMVEGIPNVVRLVADCNVLYDGELDCTYRIRASQGVCAPQFVRRFLRRLLLTTCGKPLLSYCSKPELLRAFHDFVKGESRCLAHDLMLRNHVLHGDFCPNNFIIHDGQGYFIDFDHAEITQGTHCIRSPGTGTKPYMSIRLLREDALSKDEDATIEHSASDDLELLFYIFVEFATTFDGPCGMMRDENRKPMWVEQYEISGSACWVSKQGYVLAPPIDTSLMAKTTAFFAPFSEIIQEWRYLILDAASKTNDTSPGVTHAALLSLLAKWISQLPPDAPEEIMVSMASLSRLGHPSGDNIPSSTGPRCSARLQMKR
ncbi:hypothetical protein BDR07DRAFT_1373990 [Suillus spraguei]|nr:hypothetical protein BDR07DRAFT_1373973 [Suillus spraguei]KAG2365915.1 hypothetical protein BDR07DRAFT_1373990 [Suillus spraguei]